MALKVIGSGLGRTGTASLKRALERLGFADCYHMVEVFKHPDDAALWVDAADGRPDWERLFEGYQAAVDYPASIYWRELAAYYPDAKVVHSVRDPGSWFDSTQATIFAPGTPGMDPPPLFRCFFETAFKEFHAYIHDREQMIAYFRRHSVEVEATIPPDRLLVYEVGSGWAPLCGFLGVPVPDEPFPRENDRQTFAAQIQKGGGIPDSAAIKALLSKGGGA